MIPISFLIVFVYSALAVVTGNLEQTNMYYQMAEHFKITPMISKHRTNSKLTAKKPAKNIFKPAFLRQSQNMND